MHKSKSHALWMHSALDIAVSGSPTRSARRLGFNITTIYRHLDALEQSLGVQIFIRRHNGWQLTSEAAGLLEIGKKMEQLVDQADGELKALTKRVDRHLRVAVSDDFAAYYVAQHLQGFCEIYDWLMPELVISPQFSDLSQGEVDVAIRPDMNPGDTLVGQRVGMMKHAFYASSDYFDQYGCPDSNAALSNHFVCGYGTDLIGYTASQWIERHIKSAAIIARFGNVTSMIEAVVQGVGIGLLPCYIADHIPTLKLARSIDGGLPIDLWLVTASANKKRPKVKAFFKFFATKIRSDASQFAGVPYELG